MGFKIIQFNGELYFHFTQKSCGFQFSEEPIIVAMTKSVNKIKEVVKLNKPSFNEKYKVWVVRMKTKSGWKAIWRKQKDDSIKIYDHLLKKVVKEEVKVKNDDLPKEVPNSEDNLEMVTKPSNLLTKFLGK